MPSPAIIMTYFNVQTAPPVGPALTAMSRVLGPPILAMLLVALEGLLR